MATETTEYKPLLLPGVEDELNGQEPQADGPTATDWATGEVLVVHPAAAVFPMLADDDLADLAADIQAHGLRMPCVRSANGLLVDGRNRMAACALAEVAPTYTALPPETDIEAYVLSLNVTRRHMTKGALAMASVEVAAVKSFDSRTLGKNAGVSYEYIAQARVVQQHAPDLVVLVIYGGMPLYKAHEQARRVRDAATSAEAQLARLQAAAPDLARRVVEEDWALSEAIASLETRQREAAQRQQTATRGYSQAIAFLTPGSKRTPAEKAASLTPLLVRPDQPDIDFTGKEARAAAAVLAVIADYLDAQEIRQ